MRLSSSQFHRTDERNFLTHDLLPAADPEDLQHENRPKGVS